MKSSRMDRLARAAAQEGVAFSISTSKGQWFALFEGAGAGEPEGASSQSFRGIVEKVERRVTDEARLNVSRRAVANGTANVGGKAKRLKLRAPDHE